MNIPENLRYAETHEWLLLEGDVATVGITDHAQNELTDIVYAELPAPGLSVQAGQSVAVVESVKAASDIYSPVSGEVIESNPELQSNPALINTDPYGSGWLFKLRVKDPSEASRLLSPQEYRARISPGS